MIWNDRWWGYATFKGVPATQAYWPLVGGSILPLAVTLAAQNGGLEIRLGSMVIVDKLPIKREEVRSLSFHQGRLPFFGRGIRIHHVVPVYPPQVIFFSPRARTILKRLGEMGYPISTVHFEIKG